MNLYPYLRFLHLLAAIVMVGGILSRQLVRAYAHQVVVIYLMALKPF